MPEKPPKSGWYYVRFYGPKESEALVWLNVFDTGVSWGYHPNDDPEILRDGAIIQPAAAPDIKLLDTIY